MRDPSKERWRSFSKNLGQALELPESQRGSWLRALAASEPDLAADIERKLSARHQQGFKEFLSDSLFPTEDPSRSLLGQLVGPYRIESDIGRGGIGSVWRARRTDASTEGLVAITFVDSYGLGGAGTQRFRGEDRLLGCLTHPNIARLIDAGIFNDSQPYLVTDYVEGECIDAYCERLNLGLDDRVALFRTAVAAVGHAHSQRIIHRDLKPGNILVTHDGIVKLLGYGVAKLLKENSAAAATQTYALTLSPQYAAPEQLLGHPVTVATDVYSLGLVLYRLLTGQHPVACEGRSNAELIKSVIDEASPPASTMTAQPVRRRQLQGDLDSILCKALRKDPTQRYASVDALGDDLRRFLVDQPVKARPDTRAYRAAKFVHRHRSRVFAWLRRSRS
jgi:serine/threonine protein kinase